MLLFTHGTIHVELHFRFLHQIPVSFSAFSFSFVFISVVNDLEYNHVDYFIFPGDHVTNESCFHTVDNSLTISYLPKFDLLGFICIIFHKNLHFDVSDDDVLVRISWEDNTRIQDISIYIYQDGK